MNDIGKYKRLIENAERKHMTLSEGVRFGNKEKNMILKNSDDYNIGIEYEFHPNDHEWHDSLGGTNSAMLEYITKESDMDHYGITYEDFDLLRMPTRQSFPGNNDTLWMLIPVIGEKKRFFINTNNDTVFEGENNTEDDVFKNMDTVVASMYIDTSIFVGDSDDLDIDESLSIVFDIIAEQIPEDDSYDPETACELFLDGLAKEKDSIKEYVFGDDAFEKLSKTNDFGGNILKNMYDDISIYQFFESIVTVTTRDDLNSEEIADELYDNMMEFKKFYDKNDGDIFFSNNYKRDVFPEYFEYYEFVQEDGNSGIFSELANAGITYDKVETDNDDQVEVITDAMPLKDAISHFKKMFAFIKEHGYTSNASGLHISVSTNKWNLNDINFSKLMILMNFGYIHNDLFAPRNFVEDFNKSIEKSLISRIRDVAEIASNPTSLYAAFDKIENLLDIHGESAHKMQSVKTGDYHAMNGRIELRYFGGEDYEDRLSTILPELLRALHTLDVAYGDTYDKVYNKARYKYIDERFTNTFGMSFPTMVKLYKVTEKEHRQENRPIIDMIMNGNTKIPTVGEIAAPHIAEEIIGIWWNIR